MATVASLDIALNADSRRLSRETRKAQRDIRRFGRDTAATLKRAARAGATALAGLTTAFAAASAAAVRSVNEIQRNAEFVGLAVREFDTLQFSLGQLGINLEDTTELLTRTGEIFLEAQRGSASWVDALRDINLTWQELRGLSPEQQLFRIIEGIEGVTDQSRRLGLYDEIFSDVSRRAALLGREGSAGVQAFREQLERVNGTLEASGDDFLQFTQTFQLAQRVLRNQFINALQDLAKEFGIVDGSIEELIRRAGEFTREVVVGLVTGVRDLVNFVVEWKEAFIAVGGAIAALKLATVVTTIASLVTQLKAAGVATTLLNTALLANPLILGATLVGGAIAAFIAYNDELDEMIDKIRTILGFRAEGIAGDLQDAIARVARLEAQIESSVSEANTRRLQRLLDEARAEVANLQSAGRTAPTLGSPLLGGRAGLVGGRPAVPSPEVQQLGYDVVTISETLRGLEAQLNLELDNFRNDVGTAALIALHFAEEVGTATDNIGELDIGIDQSTLDARRRGDRRRVDETLDFLSEGPLGVEFGIPQADLDAFRNDVYVQVGAALAAGEGMEDARTFSDYAQGVTNQIQNALQQTFQSGGDFGDFLKSLFVGLLGNLQSAIQGAAGGGGAGGFFSGLFGGLFGGASHEGSFGRGSSNQEVLRLVTADQSILTPRQLEAIYNSGRQAAQRPEVNIFGVNYGEDFSRRLNRQGATVGNLYNQEAAEGAFS